MSNPKDWEPLGQFKTQPTLSRRALLAGAFGAGILAAVGNGEGQALENSLYKPLMDLEATKQKLHHLSTTSNPISDRDIFEAIADTFASCGGEDWRNCDETHLPLNGEMTYLGFYAPYVDELEMAWVEFSKPNTEHDLLLEFRRNQRGNIAAYLIPDADYDIDQQVALTQNQRQQIIGRIHNGLVNSNDIETI